MSNTVSNITSSTTSQLIEAFFNTLGTGYDGSILRAIPRYKTLLTQLFESLRMVPADAPLQVLELGCGTGNLSLLIRQNFPNATLTLVDLSPEMVAQASEKLNDAQVPHTCLQSDFMTLDFSPKSFDLVIGNLSLHHLFDVDKRVLYQRMATWLKAKGMFRCGDQTLSLPAALDDIHTAFWTDQARRNGATEEDMHMWLDHKQRYDHYAPLHQHFSWLLEAGFVAADCYWKQDYWAVFGAQMP